MSKLSGGKARRSPPTRYPPQPTESAQGADHPVGQPPKAPRRRRRGASIVRSFTRPVRYAALLAGALSVLAFPSLNLEFLAWFGLVRSEEHTSELQSLR